MVWPIFWVLGGAAAAIGAGAYLDSKDKRKRLSDDAKPRGLWKPDDDIIDAEFEDLGNPNADPFFEAVKKKWDETGEEPDAREQDHAVQMLKESYQRLKGEAVLKTRLSLEAAEKALQDQGDRITSLVVSPLASGNPGRHIRVEYNGNPLPKLHVVKVVGQPLTSDLSKLQKNTKNKTILVDRLEKSPAEVFDPEETVGLQAVYYAWLEKEVSYSVYSVTVPGLELVREDATATALWGLELKELLLERPKKTAPKATAPVVPNKPPKPTRNIPHVDELTAEILLAVTPIVEAKTRKEKLEEIVKKFVDLHGLEDEAGDVAQAAYNALDAFNEKANKKG
ncbi:hypothetical protein [uncultured Roseobacter sp.]|uniref:hypothetical protein n=1 Tax=uncultured Roseobacter sp. TaxID=114847 RepID=UPI00262DF0C8|nr:hypothetical protein [uncultured Roseobacter sp.]